MDRHRLPGPLPLVVALSVAALASIVPIVANGQEDPAEQAAREIEAARERANEAARDYADTQFRLEELEQRSTELDGEHRELVAQVDALRRQVEQVAVNRFMAGGSAGIPLLTSYRQPAELLQVDVLVAVATDASASTMDRYEVTQDELDRAATAVAVNRRQLADAQALLDQRREAAEAEVVRLQEVERQRLEDERVRQVLAARREEERRLREAAAQAAAAEQARVARVAQERLVASSSAATRPDAPSPSPSPPPPPAPATAEPSGSREDGPAPPPTGPPVPTTPPASTGGRILCPVNGTAYTDTWGAARSGGRSHQGVDMLGTRGTPIHAVVDGAVLFKRNSLGGNAAWLTGTDGTRFYYAHLQGFAGWSRAVSRGEVIGYLGDSGNARGTPHLHFEVHPGGGPAVPPFPWVRDAGC